MSERLNRTATYWPPLFWLSQPFFPVLLGCSTGDLGAQPFWDMVLIPASSLQLIWTTTAQSGVLSTPSAGCWFSLQHLISNWLTSYLHPGYIIVRLPPSSCERHKSHSIQPVHGQGYILIFLDRMHLLFTQVHFLFWQLSRVGGQYETFGRSGLVLSPV